MTTVVPTSEEDPALAVVRFASELAWADAGPEVQLFPSSIALSLSVPMSLCLYLHVYVHMPHILEFFCFGLLISAMTVCSFCVIRVCSVTRGLVRFRLKILFLVELCV